MWNTNHVSVLESVVGEFLASINKRFMGQTGGFEESMACADIGK